MNVSDAPSPPRRRGPPRREGVVLVLAFALTLLGAQLHPLSHPADEGRPCVVCQVAEQPLDGGVVADPAPDIAPPVEAASAPRAEGVPHPHRQSGDLARAPPEGRHAI